MVRRSGEIWNRYVPRTIPYVLSDLLSEHKKSRDEDRSSSLLKYLSGLSSRRNTEFRIQYEDKSDTRFQCALRHSLFCILNSSLHPYLRPGRILSPRRGIVSRAWA